MRLSAHDDEYRKTSSFKLVTNSEKRPHKISSTQLQAINSKGWSTYSNLALGKKHDSNVKFVLTKRGTIANRIMLPNFALLK